MFSFWGPKTSTRGSAPGPHWVSLNLQSPDSVEDRGERPSQNGLGDLFNQPRTKYQTTINQFLEDKNRSASGGFAPGPTKDFVHGLAITGPNQKQISD